MQESQQPPKEWGDDNVYIAPNVSVRIEEINDKFVPKPPKFISDDDELVASKDYQRVLKVVKKLWDTGVILRGGGYCYSMSDMAKTLLGQAGIKSSLVECKVTIMGNDPPTLTMIGHDGSMPIRDNPNPDEMDTHVVVVTDTEIPMVIDLSIGHIQADIPYVIERATSPEPDIISKIDFKTSVWIYQRKESISVPSIHQQNILEKLRTDKQIKKDLAWMKVLIVVALIISGLNAFRGAVDFYHTYIVEDAVETR